MNENLDLTKILEGCPEGTILYSPIFGYIEFEKITKYRGVPYLIYVIATDYKGNKSQETFLPNGKPDGIFNNTECLLFPSKDQRDWSKFERFWDKPKDKKFDPNTLQPLDKVLIRNGNFWTTDFFSYIAGQWVNCVGSGGVECVPYNEETKHLIGTTDDCSEYYKWWEE